MNQFLVGQNFDTESPSDLVTLISSQFLMADHGKWCHAMW